VTLTLALVESLVKNGTMRVHGAIGSDFFMKEMAKTARSFNKKSGTENRLVAQQCLDIIQAWGEAFLPRQSQYPAFVKYYFDLRREGLPFSPEPETSRVPIFTPGADIPMGPMGEMGAGTGSGLQGAQGRQAEDAALAAAIAASVATQGRAHDAPPDLCMPSGDTRSWELFGGDGLDSGGGGGGSGPAGSVEREYPNAASAGSSVSLLGEIILHSASLADLKDDDMASEISVHLKQLLPEVVTAIEHAVVHNPQCIEELFRVNEEGNKCVAAYDGAVRGDMQMGMAKESIRSLQAQNGTLSQPALPPAPGSASKPAAASISNSLLDFEEFSAEPSPAQHSAFPPMDPSPAIAPMIPSSAFSASALDKPKPDPNYSPNPEKDRALSFEHSMYDRSSQRATEVPTMPAGFSLAQGSNPLSRRSSLGNTPGSQRSSAKYTPSPSPAPSPAPAPAPTADPFASSGVDPFGPSVGIDTILNSPVKSTSTSAAASVVDPFAPSSAPAPTANPKPVDPNNPFDMF
jgi:hypothetical protein